MIKRALLALALLGCEPTSVKLGEGGRYFRDKRTNLCFVYWYTYSQSGSREVASNVPCTPEVMRLIVQLEQENKD